MGDENEMLSVAPQRRSSAGPIRHSSASPYRSHSISKSFKDTISDEIENALLDTTNLLQMINECEDVIEGNISVLTKISEPTADILCCKYTENYEYLAAGLSDGQLKLYNVHNGSTIHCLADDTEGKRASPITAIKHRPVHKSHPHSNCVICSYTDGYVKCWNYNFLQCIYKIHEKRQTLGLTYHPRLPKFITFGDDGKLFLYDEETKMQERVFYHSDKPDVMDGHSSRIFSAVFHPLSMYEFISGGWDDTVQFWDIRQPTSHRHLSGPHICGDGLDISKNGKQILTCGYQKTEPLQVWDFRTGNLIATLEPDIYSSMLYSGKFITRDFIVCGGADQSIFRIIDSRSHLTIANIRGLTGAVYCLDGGPIRKPKKGGKVITEPSTNPRIAFCAGRKLYQIEF